MKKLTKILIIITSMFIGLNGVNAEKETYTATCTNNQLLICVHLHVW